MKTSIKVRICIVTLWSMIIFASCGNRFRGSAADTTGTNGATNGTGKIPKSEGVHNHN